jgi:hypothetical protein
MAAKSSNEFQQKINAIKKLISMGVKTEKDLSELNIEDMIYSDNTTIGELRAFTEIKKNVKSHKLYSYLTGELDVISPENSDR